MSNTINDDSTSAIRGSLLALAGFAVFSSHDAIVKTLGDYSVFQIIFFAMLFGYVPFTFARVVDPTPLSLKPNYPTLVILRSILGVGGTSFAFIAFSVLPMVQAYILLFVTPVLISLMAIVFLGEKIHVFRWFAIILGLVGVLIVLRPNPDALQWGHLAGLASAFCGAGASIISRKVGNREHSAVMIIYPLMANIIIAGGILYFVYQPMPLQDLSLMFLIGVLGLIGQLFMLQAYRTAPAAFIAPMQYSQLIWAIIFGIVFFQETPDNITIIGSLIVILSGLLIIWREARHSKIQPNLRNRNIRIVASAPSQTAELDEAATPLSSPKTS